MQSAADKAQMAENHTNDTTILPKYVIGKQLFTYDSK